MAPVVFDVDIAPQRWLPGARRQRFSAGCDKVRELGKARIGEQGSQQTRDQLASTAVGKLDARPAGIVSMAGSIDKTKRQPSGCRSAISDWIGCRCVARPELVLRA